MTFQELEKICSLLWGQTWQTELANALDIDRRTVSKWKAQGVAKWVSSRIGNVVNKREKDIKEAQKIVDSIG